MNQPFFSIVIPCFNRAGYLPAIFESLQSQSFSDFETIVVDDGSSDNIAEVVASAHLPRLHFHQQDNAGVSAARNTGASKAVGEFLIFLDSDDQVSSCWLQDFYAALQDGETDFAICAMRRMTPSGEVIEQPRIGRSIGPRRVSHNIPGSFAIRKTLFDHSGGYDKNLKFGENTELFLRLKPWTMRYALISDVNFIYQPHPQGGAKNRNNRIAANPYVIAKHKEFFDDEPLLKQQYLQVAGVDCIVLGKYAQGLKFLREGWQANPFSIKAFGRFVLGCVPPLAQMFWKRTQF